MYEKIPQELKKLKQWVCWNLVSDKPTENNPNPKPRKIPINPFTGYGAKSNDSTTWSDFDTACSAAQRYNVTGIGIMFANNVCGVDLDGVIVDGKPNAIAQDIIDTVQSYTELSPSGTGIHILCLGKLPEGRKRKDNIEMYDTTRFFTVTGKQYGVKYPINDCTDRLKIVHTKYLGEKERPQTNYKSANFSNNVSMNIDDVIERIRKSKQGDKFDNYMQGNYQLYIKGSDTSQSVGDLAFCNLLAFWCQCDTALMDAIFRRSGMYRTKWDKRRGALTYGEKTIKEAIESCHKVWEPQSDWRAPHVPLPLNNDTAQHPYSNNNYTISANTQHPTVFYKLDDTGNAYRFRDMYKDRIKFNVTDMCWMFWDGARWKDDETKQIKRFADLMLEKMENDLSELANEDDDETAYKKAFKKHIARSRNHRSKEAFIAETMHLEGIPILSSQLDTHINALNVKNCIISLKKGTTAQQLPKYYMSKIADVEYNKDALCPTWHKFLKDITCNNAELELYLQRMIGYCSTASTREQCVFFLYGNGQNGKSTFVDTISTILGDYARSCAPETVMLKDRNSSARSDLARLNGARLVCAAEAQENCRLDESTIKQMTGGTGNKLTARFLYGKEFEYVPTFKIMMSTNYKPIIKGTDNGIWRRIRLIPFTAQISNEQKDEELPEKLLAERSGILNWIIAGAVGWYEKGLPKCNLVDDAVAEYRNEMDKIQQFLDECTVEDRHSTIQSSKLYKVYQSWTSELGDRYPIAANKFAGEVKKHYESRKTAKFNEFIGLSFSDHGLSLLGLDN